LPAWLRYSGRLYESADGVFDEEGRDWRLLILSGGYGLVLPDEPIGDYGRRFSLRDWRDSLIERCLVAVADELGAQRVVALCSGSTDYAAAVRSARWGDRDVALGAPDAGGRGGAQVVVPRAQGEALAALFGGRLDPGWRSSNGLPLQWSLLATQTGDEIAEVARRLGDAWRARPVDDVDALGLPEAPGLYAWWADEKGRDELGSALGTRLPALIYAGQAGATSSRSGRPSAATLRSRIEGNHLGGNVGSSTFRRTLAACLLTPETQQVSREEEKRITGWMRSHLRLTVEALPGRGDLEATEEAVLASLDPPLNLKGMSRNPTRERLASLRLRFRSGQSGRN
jgi:hypothetical protein